MGLLEIFPDPVEMGLMPLCFMMAVYGVVLMRASEVIGGGSEMLMLLYGPGIVGGLIVPILGAVPDCAVILISGMGEGTTAEVQAQLAVGVGTLVGSTCMLLTIPWAIGAFLGRRDYDEANDCATNKRPKLTYTLAQSMTTTCITTQSDIPATSRIMMASLVTYLIIQVPSLFYSSDADGGVVRERPWAFGCLVFSAGAFLVYCWSQVKGAAAAERDRRLQEHSRREAWKRTLDRKFTEKAHQETVFRSFDKDSSGFIEPGELAKALEHLGLKCGRKDLTDLMATIDVGHSSTGDAGKADGRISLAEFQAAIHLWVAAGQDSANLLDTKDAHKKDHAAKSVLGNAYGAIQDEVKDLETEEDEDEEDEFWELTSGQLQLKACVLLFLGTLCVTIFSDPMVDVIMQVGNRLDISPFYVSFVVTPLASNAAEVYAGIMFARKKTNEASSLSLATLHGAATMNNTLCLSIFAAIIYFRDLEWEYTAEVVTVIAVVSIVALQGMFRRNIFMWQAVIVLSLYPLSLVMVYVQQTYFGLK